MYHKVVKKLKTNRPNEHASFIALSKIRYGTALSTALVNWSVGTVFQKTQLFSLEWLLRSSI